MQGTLVDTETEDLALLSGFRQVWHATANKAAAYSGYYTLGLEIPADAVGDQSIPQGNGFASFTAKDNGTLVLAGQTSDGQSFTTSAFVGSQGEVPVYVPFASVRGALHGVSEIDAGAGPVYAANNLTGALSWTKAAASAASKTRAYRQGFGPVTLTVIGGKYQPPAAGQVVMGLANHSHNALLSFAEGGLLSGQCPPFLFSIRNNTTKGFAQTIQIPALNPNKISFILTTSPAGLFSGKFTLPHASSSLVRVGSYQGLILRNGGQFQSAGYFILPMLPQPGETLANSPQASGQALLLPAP